MAEGASALGGNTTGNNNIGVGFQAGSLLGTGSGNIDIGNPGQLADDHVIRIGSSFIIQQNSAGAPNVIEGALVNFVSSGVVGATISGGGATNYGGALTNTVTANFGTVGGGGANSAGFFSTVGGGDANNAPAGWRQWPAV